MGAGEADVVIHARPRRPQTAPTIRARAVLVLLAIALLLAVGAVHRHATRGESAPPTRPPASVLGAQVVRPALVSPASAPTTTTTVLVPVAPVLAAAEGTTCADALAYLAAHQAPGFVDTCVDGSALGHLGYTCANVAGRCEGQRFIRIACPAPFVYMNEAHSSWVVIGERSGIDPYGQGSESERAACARHR